MNLEALPKYYSPKSPKLSDDAPATGSGGLTITDVMAAQGMVQSKAPLGFALFWQKLVFRILNLRLKVCSITRWHWITRH